METPLKLLKAVLLRLSPHPDIRSGFICCQLVSLFLSLSEGHLLHKQRGIKCGISDRADNVLDIESSALLWSCKAGRPSQNSTDCISYLPLFLYDVYEAVYRLLASEAN